MTLIEVLVVLAILGLLIVILLPAVQAARESARNSDCANRLKQLGIALQSFQAAHQSLPPGYISAFTATGEDTGPGWGWGSQILPQLEETALQDQLKFNLPIEDPVNQSGRLRLLSAFICPSENLPPTYTAHFFDAATGQMGNALCDVAAANFVAMFGNTEPGVDGNGLFFRNSHVRLSEITDGTSHTIAVGERSGLLGEATWVGSVTGSLVAPPPDDLDGIGSPQPEAGCGMVLGHAGEMRSPGDPKSDVNQFYSLHSGGGANFVFADGHVTFLSSDLDYRIFSALSTRAGGETTDAGDY